MDAPQHFRTAINGFRREDVVRYLEYLNAKHNTEVSRLAADADSLREEIAALKENPQASDCSQELEDLREQLEEANAEKKELEEKLTAPDDPGANDQLQALRNELEALKKSSADREAELLDRCASLEQQLQAAQAEIPPASEKNLAEQELEAYRRAERAERVANEKADLIYHRTNAILDEASGKIDGASTELSQLAEKINAQLQQMQYSINSSKVALKSAVDTMHSLHVDRN